MLPLLPSSIVAVAYAFVITVLAGVQFRRSRTPLRLGSFVMALFGLSIAALSIVYAAAEIEMSIFWAFQFVAECIAVTWVITTIIHLGYAFYPLTRHQTLIWRVALGSVVVYDLVAISELAYYIYAVWGAGILSKSSAPIPWIYWVRQVVKVTACVVTIMYLFVPLVRHHHSAGVAQIADSNTLAVGAWYLGALGLISLGYSTMLIYFLCHPESAFTPQAQSLDLCLRLLVCPIFSLPPPGCLLRYFHDKYGSTANETENPSTMVEAGITNDPRPRRPQMLVSQPVSFTSSHRRNSEYVPESPSRSSQHHRLSYDPSYQSHSPSLHQQHLQQQRTQQTHRYSISNYVPAFALKDSKLGPVHLDHYRRQQYDSASSDGERRMSGSAGDGSDGTVPSNSDDSVAGSTALSMSGDAPNDANETGLAPSLFATPSEPNGGGDDAVMSLAYDETIKKTASEAVTMFSEENQSEAIISRRRPSLPHITLPLPLPSPLPLHSERYQPQHQPQQRPEPQPLQPLQRQGQQDQQGAIVLPLSIPQPLVRPTASEPSVAFSFGEGYTSPPMVDPKQEEAKQTAQAARRISRRLTMEGRREGMDLLHISSLIKWNNPTSPDNDNADGNIHDSPGASSSRDRLHEIPAGWPRTTTAGSSSSIKPTTPLRELIPQKLGSFFTITKSSVSSSSGMTMADMRRDSATLTEHQEEEEEELVDVAATMGAATSHGPRPNLVRRSYETFSMGRSHSPAMATASMDPVHSRDRLRRSQSLTRSRGTFSTSSPALLPVSIPPPLMTSVSSSIVSRWGRSPDGRASGGTTPISPILLSIPASAEKEQHVERKKDERDAGDASMPPSPTDSVAAVAIGRD